MVIIASIYFILFYRKKKSGKKWYPKQTFSIFFHLRFLMKLLLGYYNVAITRTKYLPARLLWIIKLFIELANDNEKTYLTVECSGTNNVVVLDLVGLEANNPDKQVCYFNGQNNDQIFNVFTSTSMNNQETEKYIYFQIVRVRSRTNEDTFEANILLWQNGARNDS